MPAHDTLFVHPDDQLTATIPATPQPLQPRSRRRWAAGLALICGAAGTAAWVAVCAKVILIAWG